jgi:ubiquinone/menaquinone biosynthesis C-methylase UbiE
MNTTQEWNDIAKERLLDRIAGNDISYNTVLLPIILENIKSKIKNVASILDFGCGTGELTYEISKLNIQTIGLDISKYSIQLANEHFKNNSLSFIDKSMNKVEFDKPFDIVVANMSLMDTEKISETFTEICSNMRIGGRMLITITHPCFWPIYWDYFNDDGFNYLEEQKITKTYKTTKTTFSGFKTTHFHRPVNFYLNLFSKNHMKLIKMQELKNPIDKMWYPRFLYFEIEK